MTKFEKSTDRYSLYVQAYYPCRVVLSNCSLLYFSWEKMDNNSLKYVTILIMQAWLFVLFILIRLFEPAHEIMALFVFRKLILQTRMHSHPVGLDVWFLVEPFVYFNTSCVRTAKALARLHGCAGWPESSLVAYVISTIISWAGSFYFELLFPLIYLRVTECICWNSITRLKAPKLHTIRHLLNCKNTH